MRCAVVVPTYKERENIERLAVMISDLGLDTLLVIVDDASPDGTGDVADRLAAGNRDVRVIHRPAKEGYGRALTAGFLEVLGNAPDVDALISMDADLSHPPRYLPAVMKALADHDVVIGSRYVDGGGILNWSMPRRLLSRFGNLYARILTGLPVRDCTSGFVAYRRRVLESIPLSTLQAQGYSFLIEMKCLVRRAGFSIAEVPIQFVEREAGESKMTARIAFEALRLVWRLRGMARGAPSTTRG